MQTSSFFRALLITLAFLPHPALADDKAKDDVPSYTITMEKEFSPLELEIPADKKVKIVVVNHGVSPIEFESSQLKREKIVQPGAEVTINLGPLSAGSYKYKDDFNSKNVGFITAK